MKDSDLVDFMEWAAPQLRLQWSGFRKVRSQVKRRLEDRMLELRIRNVQSYRDYLSAHAEEWAAVDAACRITVSRFYRDRAIFDTLRDALMPDLARRAAAEDRPVRIWSAGAASGEEPYTLSMIWKFCVEGKIKKARLQVVATDVNPHMLDRAARGMYPKGCLEELPEQWRSRAFDAAEGEYKIRETFRKAVDFRKQDVRQERPDGVFDLVACRYLIFTYFAPELQGESLGTLRQALRPGGYLVLGHQESLPAGTRGFMPCFGNLPIYRKVGD